MSRDDEPVNLAALRADDELIEALRAGKALTDAQLAAAAGDERLGKMIDAWQKDVNR